MDSRLLISFVLDNSAAVQGDRFAKIKAALNNYFEKMRESGIKNIELEIVVFDEFSPAVYKAYSDDLDNISDLEMFKMPFLGKAINKALDDLISRYDYYKSHDVPLYKPWLFVLSDAYSFDDLDEPANRLKTAVAEGKILYMPFILSQKKIPLNIEPLLTTKRFMRIKDNAYDLFFKWFYDMSVKRASTPIGDSVKFDRSGFEGWAIL